MPSYYVLRAALDKTIHELEMKGEELVTVLAEADNFHVFTRPSNRRPGKYETR